jgi:biotin-[acetyl-CoA-carboxylase] ligase BirA-like protein
MTSPARLSEIMMRAIFKLACPCPFFNEQHMHHIHLKKCLSTQSSFKEIWDEIKDEQKLLVTSQEQTAGVGRRGRSWFSNKNSLIMSCSVKAQNPVSLTPLAIAVAISKFFQKKDISLQLKWPNDLLNKQLEKVGGILCQSLSDNYVLVGIGLNLFFEAEEIKTIESDYPIGHLDLIHSDKNSLAKNIYQEILALEKFEKQEWMNLCAHQNQEVQIIESGHVQSALFKNLDHDGAAIVSIDGQEQRIINGSLRISR